MALADVTNRAGQTPNIPEKAGSRALESCFVRLGLLKYQYSVKPKYR
jgi:hypothetical protein